MDSRNEGLHCLSGKTSRLGYWKAEDYQKLCFPASEAILYNEMPADEFQCWKLLVQMVAMVFNCCQTHGWTNKDIELLIKLAWHHDIITEGRHLVWMLVSLQNTIWFMLLKTYTVFHLRIITGRLTQRELLNGMLTRQQIIKTLRRQSDNETRRQALQNLEMSSNRKNAPVLTHYSKFAYWITATTWFHMHTTLWLRFQMESSLLAKTKDFKWSLKLNSTRYSRISVRVEQKLNIALFPLSLKDTKAF